MEEVKIWRYALIFMDSCARGAGKSMEVHPKDRLIYSVGTNIFVISYEVHCWKWYFLFKVGGLNLDLYFVLTNQK